jgi:hypothetical protein
MLGETIREKRIRELARAIWEQEGRPKANPNAIGVWLRRRSKQGSTPNPKYQWSRPTR